MGIIFLVSLDGQDCMQFNSCIKGSSMPSAKQFNVTRMKDNAYERNGNKKIRLTHRRPTAVTL